MLKVTVHSRVHYNLRLILFDWKPVILDYQDLSTRIADLYLFFGTFCQAVLGNAVLLSVHSLSITSARSAWDGNFGKCLIVRVMGLRSRPSCQHSRENCPSVRCVIPLTCCLVYYSRVHFASVQKTLPWAVRPRAHELLRSAAVSRYKICIITYLVSRLPERHFKCHSLNQSVCRAMVEIRGGSVHGFIFNSTIYYSRLY